MSRSLFEALFLRALSGTITPELHSRLVAVGVDLSRPLATGYPMDLFNAAAKLVLEHRYGAAHDETDQRALGWLWADGFLESPAGRVTCGLIRLIGVGRFVLQMNNHIRNVALLGPAHARQVREGQVEIALDDVCTWPAMVEGVFERALQRSGVDGARVRFTGRLQNELRVYEVQWQQPEAGVTAAPS